MKRTIIAVCLAAAVGAGCFAETHYVSKSTTSALKRIEEIDRLAEKRHTDAAIEACKRLESEWDGTMKWLDTLLFHDYVDSVGVNLTKMRVQLQNGAMSLYLSESAEAKKGLASIKGSEYPLLENIL